jgi:AmiR/NasT family two-component response regulator
MRVWVVDDGNGDDAHNLRRGLDRLSAAGTPIMLLGTGPFPPDLMARLRACQADLLLMRASAVPDGQTLAELAELDISIVVLTDPERSERFLSLGETRPLCLLPCQPDEYQLHLGLLTAATALRRHIHWKIQVDKLQQRLDDRIVVERAKGILVQRLGVSEEEAYRRLRVISRRQRRQIRDIAQSLLDAESLFLPELNGVPEPEGSPPPTA